MGVLDELGPDPRCVQSQAEAAAMAIELVFETHAITTDNEAGIATGWLPGQLSERGRRSAAELGERRRDDGIAVVYVSDLHRAMETARIAFAAMEIPVIPDPRLRECDYGQLNGMPAQKIAAERAQHVDEPWPGGESYRQVVERMRQLLADVVRGWDESRILLIGHSANKWALDHLLLGKSLTDLVAAGLSWQPGWKYILPTPTAEPVVGGRDE